MIMSLLYSKTIIIPILNADSADWQDEVEIIRVFAGLAL